MIEKRIGGTHDTHLPVGDDSCYKSSVYGQASNDTHGGTQVAHMAHTGGRVIVACDRGLLTYLGANGDLASVYGHDDSWQ